MAKRKPKLVHLTHHACLANGLGLDTLYDRLYDESAERYHKDRYEAAYGTYARRPASTGHLHCRYSGKTSLLTTELAEVTCSTCLHGVERESREYLFEKASSRGILDSDRRWYEKCAEAWCDDKELKFRAWLVCCRHVGAPCPMSRSEAITRMRQARSDVLFHGVRSATLFWTLNPNVTKSLTDALAKVDPEDRKLMQATIAQAKQIDSLLSKVRKLSTSIEHAAAKAAKRIAKHASVGLPTTKAA